MQILKNLFFQFMSPRPENTSAGINSSARASASSALISDSEATPALGGPGGPFPVFFAPPGPLAPPAFTT